MMDDLMLRFPHIGQQIFDKLDNVNLAKCQEVSTSWCDFINYQKNTYIKIIRTYIPEDEFKELWSPVLHKYNSETVMQLACGVQKFYNDFPKKIGQKSGRRPLHYAAYSGQLSVCEYIMKNTQDKCPKDNDGIMPLHYAAQNNQLVVCQYIMENVEDKFPKDNN